MPKIKVQTTKGGHTEDMVTFNVLCVDDINPTSLVAPPANLSIQLYRNGNAVDTPKEITIENQIIQFHLSSAPGPEDTFRFRLNQPILFDTLFLYNEKDEAVQEIPQQPVNGEYGFFFDFEGTGNANYAVAYKPGTGWFGICKLGGVPRIWNYQSKPINPTSWDGIGGYDLVSPYDRVFAFDYLSSGKLDHLVCYRPGHGTIWILKHEDGVFSRIFGVGEGQANGIQGFPLNHTDDLVFACKGKTGNYDCLALSSQGRKEETTVLR